MFDLIAGLPWHVLVVHAVVVIAPLAALTAIVYAVWARSRRALRWPLIAASVVVFVAALVANNSGEVLQHRVEAAAGSGEVSAAEVALVSDHVEIGGVTAAVCAGFALGMLVCLLWLLPAQREAILQHVARGAFPLAVRVAIVLVSILVVVVVIWAGHSGAAAAWTGRLG